MKENIKAEGIEIIADRENFYQFIFFIENYLAKIEITKEVKSNILLAAEEIIINIIYYAYEKEKGTIAINLWHDENSIYLNFTDYGKPFNPLELQETDVSLPIDERGDGGYGILIVKKIMNSVNYEYRNGKNSITLIKYINK